MFVGSFENTFPLIFVTLLGSSENTEGKWERGQLTEEETLGTIHLLVVQIRLEFYYAERCYVWFCCAKAHFWHAECYFADYHYAECK